MIQNDEFDYARKLVEKKQITFLIGLQTNDPWILKN